jgi:hypothetical protein
MLGVHATSNSLVKDVFAKTSIMHKLTGECRQIICEDMLLVIAVGCGYAEANVAEVHRS